MDSIRTLAKRHTVSIISLLLLIQGAGCASNSTHTPDGDDVSPTVADSIARMDNKFDAPLRASLHEMARADDESAIQCLIEVDEGMNDERRARLEEAGLRVVTVVGAVATVEGPPSAIKKAAAYRFVKSISLSQTRYPRE